MVWFLLYTLRLLSRHAEIQSSLNSSEKKENGMRFDKHIPSARSFVLQGLLVALSLFLAAPAQASLITYAIEFTDSANNAVGTGSFIWNTDTDIMTSLKLNVSGLSGMVLDSALSRTYHSYDLLATTYGELFYRFLTDSTNYMLTQYNPLSSSVGLMPSDVTGDLGFIAFGVERESTGTSYASTYIFYDRSWNVAASGYASTAAAVPEPATMLLLGSGLAGLLVGRRKRAQS
jgi:hypothetical protein